MGAPCKLRLMGDPRGSYNQAKSWALDADEERLGREWLGYGSLDAPYWFIGLEPGGEYDPLVVRYWIESLGAAPAFDPLRDARAGPNPWFLPTAQSQPTWKPLIEAVLGYTGSTEDALDYQRSRFGCVPPVGEIAALELSAFAAQGGASPSPHRYSFLDERIAAIQAVLTAAIPVFAILYGTSQREAFRQIVGGFDDDGFNWCGKTLCALVPHPNARGPRRDWRYLGIELRQRVEAAS